ncbi:DUF1642 domain-containing protein [Enterococcus sp. AZ101]|uniref:DUF1642 domain-containing protein n=1 Tax=Enterococcus sp. AZ101 TaxID=2774742 RepID=UPI003D271B2B
MGIEELEEYVESLNPVDTWGWSVKRDRVWADKSSLLYFVGEIKQQLKSSLPTQQDKVVVPELPRHIIDYLKWCERNNKTLLEVIGGARCHDADYVFWTEEERRKIAVAYATGDYTVEKEQLYVVEIGGMYLKEPLADTSDYTIKMTWNREYAYQFKSWNVAREHISKLGGEIVPVEEGSQ